MKCLIPKLRYAMTQRVVVMPAPCCSSSKGGPSTMVGLVAWESGRKTSAASMSIVVKVSIDLVG